MSFPRAPVRPPVSLQAADPCRNEHRVRIRHPGYGDNVPNILLNLPAVESIAADPTTSNQPQEGTHHRTVLTACAIIANNAFERVYLTHDHAGDQPVDTGDLDGLLVPGDYWLHLSIEESEHDDQARPANTTTRSPTPPSTSPSIPPSRLSATAPGTAIVNAAGETKPYPIVPSFRDWRFPHGKLPSQWRSPHQPPQTDPTNLSALAKLPCCISGARLGTNSCHIIPQAAFQKDWFDNNEMDAYIPNAIDGCENKIKMRADLHFVFDSNRFTIAPKPLLDANSYAFTVHVLKDDRDELIPIYQNRAIRSEAVSGLSREALFARFAYSIFPLVQSFLQTMWPRHLAVVVPESTGSQVKLAWMNRQQLTAFRDERGETPTGSKKRGSTQLSRDEGLDSDDEYEERCERRNRTFIKVDDDDDDQPDECTRWYHEVGIFAADRKPGEELLTDCTRGYFERYGWPASFGNESGSEHGGDLDTEPLPNLSHSSATCSNRSSALLEPPAVEGAGRDTIRKSIEADPDSLQESVDNGTSGV